MKLAAQGGIGGPEPQPHVVAGTGQVHVHAPAGVLVGESHPQTLHGRTARSLLGRGDPREGPAGRRFLSRPQGRIRRSGSARNVCSGRVQNRGITRFLKSRRPTVFRSPSLRRTGSGRQAAFEILSGEHGLGLLPDRSSGVREAQRLVVRCTGRLRGGFLRRAGARPQPQYGLRRVRGGSRPARRLSGCERHRGGRGLPGRRKPRCLRAHNVPVADEGASGGRHRSRDAERGDGGAPLCGRGCFRGGDRLHVPVSRGREKQFEAKPSVPLPRAGGQRRGRLWFQRGVRRIPFDAGSRWRRGGSGPRYRRRRRVAFQAVWRRVGLAGQKFG